MRRIGATIIGFVSIVLLTTKAFSSPPPVGQRAYILDGKNKAAPVAIKKVGAGGELVLRDPVVPSGPVVHKDTPFVAPHKKKPAPVAKPVVKSGQMKFQKVSVSGHLKRPRVEFGPSELTVDRADELDRPDFFQKVYDPARSPDF